MGVCVHSLHTKKLTTDFFLKRILLFRLRLSKGTEMKLQIVQVLSKGTEMKLQIVQVPFPLYSLPEKQNNIEVC